MDFVLKVVVFSDEEKKIKRNELQKENEDKSNTKIYHELCGQSSLNFSHIVHCVELIIPF